MNRAADEIRKLGDEELVRAAVQLERDYVDLLFKHRTQRLEDTSSLKKTRRQLARYHTVMRERERERGLPKGSLLASARGLAPAAVEEPETREEASKGFLKGIVDKITGRE